MAQIVLKRIYEDYEKSDGYRILVDRLWPRGISKENAQLDLWLKEIAPTNELRRWFNHEVGKWEGFTAKYLQEISDNKEQTTELLSVIKSHEKVTLLFGAKDIDHNQAVILKKWIEKNA
ncbi:MAG: DUF488 domain-containing protein [Brumimicrobium sp.]